ncbi:MAG: hypothetical protein ACXVWO_14025 [Gaiellaceae bacterium]
MSYVRARVPSPLIRTPTVRVTDLQQNEPINLTVAQIDQRPVSQMFLTDWFVPHNEFAPFQAPSFEQPYPA